MNEPKTIKDTILEILAVVGFSEKEKSEALTDISDIATLEVVQSIINELPEAERATIATKFTDAQNPEQQKEFLALLQTKSQEEINERMIDAIARVSSGYIDNLIRIANDEQKAKIMALMNPEA